MLLNVEPIPRASSPDKTLENTEQLVEQPTISALPPHPQDIDAKNSKSDDAPPKQLVVVVNSTSPFHFTMRKAGAISCHAAER